MPNCPYCETPINEDYSFCINCEKQVKCLNSQCESYLLKDKSKCLKCGTPVEASNLRESDTILNTFSLEEKQSKNSYFKKVNLCLTNKAIGEAAPFLGHFPGTPISTINHQQPTRIPKQKNALPAVQDAQEAILIDENGHLPEETSEKTNQKINDGYNNPLNFFDADEQGNLISKTRDYKGKNRKEQQQRFCLIYVWAYNLIYEKEVPDKDYLNHLAQQIKIYDKNFSGYFKEIASRYFLKPDVCFKLNNDGLTKVESILLEIYNSEQEGFEYWKSSNKPANKKPRINKEDMQKVGDWIQLQSKFDGFDIRNLNTTANYALFAIYVLTKELKVQEAVKPALAYQYIKDKYQTISLKKSIFTSILSHKDYKKYFDKTPEGLYYLTTEAENVIENLLSQESTKTI